MTSVSTAADPVNSAVAGRGSRTRSREESRISAVRSKGTVGEEQADPGAGHSLRLSNYMRGAQTAAAPRNAQAPTAIMAA